MSCLFFSTVLEIGFERLNYTYNEPSGFSVLSVDNIFMVKNIETELTYGILLQRIAGTATRFSDYVTSVDPSVTTDFPPTTQRLQLFGGSSPAIFEIFADNIPEGEESIEISSEPVDHPLPAYTRPQRGAVTTIFILDNDSKKKIVPLHL